jgi:hypothetical protein
MSQLVYSVSDPGRSLVADDRAMGKAFLQRSVIEEPDMIAEEEKMYVLAIHEWLQQNAPKILREDAFLYAKGLYSARISTIEELADRLKRDPNTLDDITNNDDDVGEILAALRAVGLINGESVEKEQPRAVGIFVSPHGHGEGNSIASNRST